MKPQGSPTFAEAMSSVLGQASGFSPEPLAAFLTDICQGRADPRETMSMLAALSARPADVDMSVLIARFIATEAQDRCGQTPVDAHNIVGTGGGAPSFNISTTTAFVAAAAGVPVLKSGSASYSSSSGAIDFLKAAGIRLATTRAEIDEDLETLGVSFYMPGSFSRLLQRFAMAAVPRPLKHYAPYLNTIGPTLPFFALRGQLVGVSCLERMPFYQDMFAALDGSETWLVHGHAGYDEACSFSQNTVLMHKETWKKEVFSGRDLGFGQGSSKSLLGGSAEENVAITKRLLAGKIYGPPRDCVVLNAALLISQWDQTLPLDECIDAAEEALVSRRAQVLFEKAGSVFTLRAAS